MVLPICAFIPPNQGAARAAMGTSGAFDVKQVITGAAVALIALTMVAGSGAEAASAGQPTGIWRNPKNSVHIRVQPCGQNVCGTVVWANDRAREKARKAGTPNLIGKQLFQEFRPDGPGSWGGRVFVPDLQRTVSGKLRTQGPNSVVASGCLLGRFLCKSQTWTRIS
jgi:uncharacterized protein (DUF2147 family)